MSEVQLIVSEPWLYSTDIRASQRHLIDTLGFEYWFDDDEFQVVGVRRGDFLLRVRHAPKLVAALSALPIEARPVIRIVVRGVDALYEEHRERGANIVSEIADHPWGDREYTIAEPGGCRLTFTEDLASVRGEPRVD